MLLRKLLPLLASLAGAVLLWAAWPVSPLTLLIFVAWIPMLWLEANVNSWKKFTGYTLIHMFLWNLLITWWVALASAPGAVGAFVVNSIAMTIPWLLFYFTKRRLGQRIGYAGLIVYWLAFEFLHHNWDLAWPWLTLGNSFAVQPGWVQWYQYTGASGGTLWILVTNLLAWSLINHYRNGERGREYRIRLAGLVLLLTTPILLSRLIISSEKKIASAAWAGADRNIVVVQPNIDPYTEKFEAGSLEQQLNKLITLSESAINRGTRLVVWPETAIPAQVREDMIKEDFRFRAVWSFLKRHPNVSLLTGLDSYIEYGTDRDKASPYARFHKPSGIYYDMFNTAALMEVDSTVQFYHKAKLVPGVETLPSFLNFMGKWFEDFGGVSGTLGRDKERKVFVPWDQYYKSAPIICYESIFSDYLTEFVRRGANVLVIITNDGWWDDTPGYRQHMNYARLRAIETRKWIARSANTGISCFIDPLGNVINPQPWDTEAAIRYNIPVDNRQTFYVKYGDLLSRTATVLALGLLVWLLIQVIRKRLNRKAN